MVEKDPYAVLGVARDATPEQIKKTYRKLARKHHPDVNPGDKKAEDRFKEVSAAFEVLSDPEKKKLYDELGEDAAKIGFDPEKAAGYRRWKEQSQQTRADGGAAGGFNLEDLFGDLFSRSRESRREPRARPSAGADIEAEMTVGLIEALRGGEREIELSKPVTCSTCNGTGTTGSRSDCLRCNGLGQIDVSQGPLNFQTHCPVCGGTGKMPGPPCPSCQGRGYREEPVRLKVKVPSGVKDGQKIRLKSQGLPGTAGGRPGDLMITVHVASHPFLRREGDDLYLDLPVTVGEAMFGAKVDVPTLDGTVKLTIPRASQSGQKLRLKGKGVRARKGEQAGDFYVVLMVKAPDPSTDEEKARRAVDELASLYTKDVRAGLEL